MERIKQREPNALRSEENGVYGRWQWRGEKARMMAEIEGMGDSGDVWEGGVCGWKAEGYCGWMADDATKGDGGRGTTGG